MENADENKVFAIGFRTPPSRQHGSTAYHGTLGTVWFKRVPL